MNQWLKIQVPDDFDQEQTDLKLTGHTDTTTYCTSTRFYEPEYRDVLDYGFVGLVDWMGSDQAIVDAARVSYGRGTSRKRSDEGLIRYLMRHRHTTPFEMCEFKFHVKAPIFVFRQWHRHRTASINEYSGRYSEMTDEMYLPAPQDAMPQSQSNKQGREGNILSENDYNAIRVALEEIFRSTFETYQYLLGSTQDRSLIIPEQLLNRKLFVEDAAMKAIRKVRDENPDTVWTDEMIEEKIREWYDANDLSIVSKTFPGLTRELARICLPVATYSQMYWKTNLKNLFHFISLRSDSHAQKEIRVYSDAMLDMIRPYVPWSVQAFLDYDLYGTHLSNAERKVIRHLFTTHGVQENEIRDLLAVQDASDREVTEFLAKFL